jgi:aminoglycoside 6'-N-acetyltransferase I
MAVIRAAFPSDCEQLARLRQALWPESSAEEHAQELELILTGKPPGATPLVEFVAESDAMLVGFLEAGLRSHAEGCYPSPPVGYVEGWYVVEGYRQRGIGSGLLQAAENWAREQGCREMASDARIDNVVSQRVHEAVGYVMVERCVHYRKPL